jgi:AraC family transcriptional regulator
MDVRFESRPAQQIAFIRHIGPYQEVGPTWEALCTWAAGKGLMGPQTRMFGRAWDDPDNTPADQIRYDACIVLAPDQQRPETADAGAPQFDETWAGDYAVTVHEGAWDGLAATYGALFGQVAAAGRIARDDQPCLEIYLNDPSSTPPAELRTEICMPLAG